MYLYKGTLVVQKRDYYLLSSSIERVDLYLGDRRSFNKPWVEYKNLHSLDPEIDSVHSKSFKRIVRDFSLSLQTRSENGWLPSLSIPEIRRNDRVSRVSVTIGAFSVRMTGEEFYRFLNVIRFTLLVNPTNPIFEEAKSDDSSTALRNAKKLSSEVMRAIEAKVINLVKREDSVMLPYLKVKYNLQEVEWTLLTSQDQEIAVATLRGLVGEHIFCFDGKSESSIVLNDLRIVNPVISGGAQRWKSPEVIFDPVILDRDKNDQNNILEIIAVTRKPIKCDGMTVSVLEHVGVNVFPGCHYYILFQLTSSVASELLRYFFPEEYGSSDSAAFEQEAVSDGEDSTVLRSNDASDANDAHDAADAADANDSGHTAEKRGEGRPSIVFELSTGENSSDNSPDVCLLPTLDRSPRRPRRTPICRSQTPSSRSLIAAEASLWAPAAR